MTDYVITTYQTSTPPEEFAEFRTEGEWYWQLDDGHLPGVAAAHSLARLSPALKLLQCWIAPGRYLVTISSIVLRPAQALGLIGTIGRRNRAI